MGEGEKEFEITEDQKRKVNEYLDQRIPEALKNDIGSHREFIQGMIKWVFGSLFAIITILNIVGYFTYRKSLENTSEMALEQFFQEDQLLEDLKDIVIGGVDNQNDYIEELVVSYINENSQEKIESAVNSNLNEQISNLNNQSLNQILSESLKGEPGEVGPKGEPGFDGEIIGVSYVGSDLNNNGIQINRTERGTYDVRFNTALNDSQSYQVLITTLYNNAIPHRAFGVIIHDSKTKEGFSVQIFSPYNQTTIDTRFDLLIVIKN